jgi:hypothetical protein
VTAGEEPERLLELRMVEERIELHPELRSEGRLLVQHGHRAIGRAELEVAKRVKNGHTRYAPRGATARQWERTDER